MYKKILSLILLIILLSGCNIEPNYGSIYDAEIYKNQIALDHYAIGIRPDGYYQAFQTFNSIYDTEILIVPSFYNGIPIVGFGPLGSVNRQALYEGLTLEERYAMSSELRSDHLASIRDNNLKEIYFGSHHSNIDVDGLNLEKIVFLSDLYFNSLFEEHRLYSSKDDIYSNVIKFFSSNNDNPDFVKVVSKKSYDYYKVNHYDTFKDFVPANIEFYYNIDSAPCEMYWIDYEKDQTLIFEPPVPYLEGYEFLGWYKEPECINKWDFDKDMIESSLDLENMVQLKLYAKWK